MILFKGKKKGMVHTMDIKGEHLREVFFPRTFSERYRYLGYIYMNEESSYKKYLQPLVLTMDYYARPRWCPRWFLRFLYLFGRDNSLVRVRNRTLSNLHGRLTKGILMWDWKTKWSDYDLRISLSGPEFLHEIATNMEHVCYQRGRKEEVLKQLEKKPELKDRWNKWDPLHELEKLLEEDEKD